MSSSRLYVATSCSECCDWAEMQIALVLFLMTCWIRNGTTIATALTGILSALSSQSDFTWQYVTSSIIKGRKESNNMKDQWWLQIPGPQAKFNFLALWGSETDWSCRPFIVEAFHCLLQWFIIFLFLMLCSWCWRSGLFGFGARCVFSSWNGICGGDAAGKLEGYEGLESYSLGRRGREVGE